MDDDVAARWLRYARRARRFLECRPARRGGRRLSPRLELSSQAVLVDWYRQRVADCERRSHWRTPLWYLDRCLAAEPTNGDLYAIRARVLGRLDRRDDHLAEVTKLAERGADGEALIGLADEHAALGHWAPATALYAEARRRGALPLPALVRGALVELKLGDRSAYGSLCGAMLERQSEVDTPEEADFIARICARAGGHE